VRAQEARRVFETVRILMTGVCRWCGENVDGPEVRPGLIVCESPAPIGVSVVQRAHWLGLRMDGLQKTDEVPQSTAPALKAAA